MDACHILFGRPWLFDRRFMDDGKLNTYTFVKERKKIFLIPLKISQIQKPEDSSLLDVFLAALLKSQHHEFQLPQELILLSLEPENTPLPIHPLLQSLLVGVNMFFPLRYHPDYPLKRAIQHNIDLALGSIAPNNLHIE